MARSRRFCSLRILLTALLLGTLLAACRRRTPTPTPIPTPLPTATGQATQAPILTSLTPVATATPTPRSPMVTPTPEDAGTVILWHSWSGADGDALREILTNFRQTHPDIRVETLFVAYDELPQAYTDAVLAKGGPDLILAPNWWLQDLVGAGVLLPLGDRVDAAERAQYTGAAIDNLSYDGQLYGLPTNYELVSLYYNRSLVPPEKLPRTAEDLIERARENPSQGAGIYTNFYHLFWGIPAYGGELFDSEGRVILDRTPGTAQFLGWLKRAQDTEGLFVDLDYGMLIDRFKKGEYAFFIDGPWSTDELRGALGDDLGVTLLPAGPAGPARPWLSADGVFLSPVISPEQQQLALTLARHLTSAESETILARTARRLPARRDADPGDDPILLGFVRQAADAIPEPHRPEMNQVWGYAGDMIVKVLSGAATPEEAVTEATTLINEANGR